MSIEEFADTCQEIARQTGSVMCVTVQRLVLCVAQSLQVIDPLPRSGSEGQGSSFPTSNIGVTNMGRPLAMKLAFIVFTLLLCAGCGGTKSAQTTPPPPSIAISPTSATVQVGATQQFTATVTGSFNTNVNWSVNGTVGGNSTVGSISSSGLFTSPASVPNPSAVTVTATSAADPAMSAPATVTVSTLPPPPNLENTTWNVTVQQTSSTATMTVTLVSIPQADCGGLWGGPVAGNQYQGMNPQGIVIPSVSPTCYVAVNQALQGNPGRGNITNAAGFCTEPYLAFMSDSFGTPELVIWEAQAGFPFSGTFDQSTVISVGSPGTISGDGNTMSGTWNIGQTVFYNVQVVETTWTDGTVGST